MVKMSSRDHYIDFLILERDMTTRFSPPALMIHADPPSYGQRALDATMKYLIGINENSKTKIELTKMDGTHHFHMIKPKETAEMIHKFLDKHMPKPSTKL